MNDTNLYRNCVWGYLKSEFPSSIENFNHVMMYLDQKSIDTLRNKVDSIIERCSSSNEPINNAAGEISLVVNDFLGIPFGDK